MIIEPCFYCGDINSSYLRDYRKGKLVSDIIIYYNGIDRVDSNKGYIKTNTVVCCKRCNVAKSDMSVLEFKEWLNRIYKNFIELENSEENPYCNVGKMRVENV